MEPNRYHTGQVVVASCEAFFKVLNLDCVMTHCNNCFLKNPELEICQGCNRVSYCDDDCKSEDWEKGHQLECISTGFPLCIEKGDAEIKNMIFRLYAMLKMNPDLTSEPYDMYDGTIRCFDDLRAKEIFQDRDVPIVHICQDMVEYLNAEHPDIRFEYLLRLYGIFEFNSLPICENDVVLGNGIYIQASCFDHSCKPLTNCLTTKAKLEIRTNTVINGGVLPTISYCDLSKHYTTLVRRRILLDKYQFDCQCVKCLQEMENPVNYDMVQLLNSRMNSLFNGDHAGDVLEWIDIQPLHNDLLNFLRELFNEFDMIITKYLMSMYYFSLRIDEDSEFTSQLRSQVLGHIAVSVGVDSELFQRFPFGR